MQDLGYLGRIEAGVDVVEFCAGRLDGKRALREGDGGVGKAEAEGEQCRRARRQPERVAGMMLHGTTADDEGVRAICKGGL